MTYKKSGIGFLCLRVFCCLLSGLLVSMALLGMLDTYSYFSELMPKSIEVSAVSSDEIMPTFEIIQQIPGEYAEIHIQGAEDLKYVPTIYFTVEMGTSEKKVLKNLPDYVLHIDPVELQKNQLYKIPIEPIVNLPQRVELMLHELMKKETVNGVIRAKYLNGFIDKEIPVSFKISYLKKCFEQQIRRKPIEIEKTDEQRASLQQELAEIISTAASYGDWEEARWGNSGEAQTERAMPQKSLRRTNLTAVNSKNDEFEPIAVPITRLETTEEQQELLNILVPRLTTYLDEVYQTVLNLVSQLNEKIGDVVRLNNQIEELAEQNEELAAKNDELKQEKEGLLSENEKLQEENNKLLSKVDDLRSQVDSLQNQLTMSSSGGSGGGGATPPGISKPEEPPTGTVPGEEVKPEEPPAGGVPGEEMKPEEPPAGGVPGEEMKPEEPPAGGVPGEEMKPEEPPAGGVPGEEMKPKEPPAGGVPGEEMKPEEPPAGGVPGEEMNPEEPPAGGVPGREVKPEEPAVKNTESTDDYSQSSSDDDNDRSKEESIKSLKVKIFQETVINKREEDEGSLVE